MISVIIPAYNAADFIGETLDSILRQTYQQFEVIVVDDGSTDNTVEIVKQYAAKDDRIRLIQNDHGGACKARNTAIAAAKYPWVAAMDADDVMRADRFEKQIKAAEQNPEVVVWGSYLTQINIKGEPIGTIRVGPTSVEEFNAVDRTQHAIVVTNSSAMFKRDVALQAGCYDERLVAAQDTEFWDRMANYGPVVVIPEPLVSYRLHGQSISAKKFFKQRMLHDYVIARNKAKARGETITMEQYIADYNNKPPLVRFQRSMHNQGRFYYRNAGVMLAQKKYPQAALSLAVSAVLSPQFWLRRVVNRFVPQKHI
ncbi:MAG: glycosyltransferase family 2 protein [bacterium]|nr:glycosyltransferase family 2 protein [bacterium]